MSTYARKRWFGLVSSVRWCFSVNDVRMAINVYSCEEMKSSCVSIVKRRCSSVREDGAQCVVKSGGAQYSQYEEMVCNVRMVINVYNMQM